MTIGRPEPLPHPVRQAIWKAYPDQAGEIISSLEWDGLNGNFYFWRWGMYVGVELDGYIHT
jgi:hypothetical protein